MTPSPVSEPEQGFGYWWAVVLGAVLALIGLVLFAGGAWLAALGGSWYYLIVGTGLVLAGGLTASHRRSGALVYLILWLCTLAWAFWEVGFDGWALVPRVVAPTVLLVLVLLTIPALRRPLLPTAAAALAGLSALSPAPAAHARETLVPAAAPAETANPVPQPTTLEPGPDWPVYGGSNAAMRFSPLDQITPANVSQLKPAWTFHTGDLPNAKTEGKYSPENTPLKVGDTLYACTGMDIVVAIDPATGKEKWRHDPKVPADAIPYGATCRGVAWYAVPGASADAACATRIVWGTLDARLLAIDARTGTPCEDFGTHGAVDLSEGIGYTVPGWYSVTAPPVIVRGIVVTGAQVKDNEATDAPSGVIRGYDAVTGQLAWAWDMGAPDRSGAPAAGQTYTRGTPNMWTVATGDDDLGLVYLPLGNAAGDYWGPGRSDAENDYASSLVALDVRTGKPAWRFQTIHHDVWDYDLGSQVTLVDLTTDTGKVPALILPSKQGQIYVLNRRTGESLFPVDEKPAPKGDGPESGFLAATQPHSGYARVDKPKLTERDMWGMSPIDQLFCRIQFRRAAYDGEFTGPTADRPYVEYPGYNGGSDWGSVAVDPTRGILVVNYNDTANFNRLVPRTEADRQGIKPIYQGGSPKSVGEAGAMTGAPYAISVNAGWRVPGTGLLCTRPPYGWIRGIELATGKTLWEHPFGSAEGNGPFGIASHLPLTIGTPNNGGAVVTAGGVTFIAATTDQKLRAYETATGKELWSADLPGGGQATPLTYEVDGRQYVVIAPGGHHFMETPVSDAIVAYVLPKL
ncbi:MAG: membrane-bound PQQ-dependent dehydrogenase, glucose/quinate/shikimate family [Amaricoccus sp.]